MCLLSMLYGGYYASNLKRGHLIDGKERGPEMVAPFLLAGVTVAGINGLDFGPIGVLVPIGYLACLIPWFFYKTFYSLRNAPPAP